eukprot:132643-Pelagomonas_calceolata.AAC.2
MRRVPVMRWPAGTAPCQHHLHGHRSTYALLKHTWCILSAPTPVLILPQLTIVSSPLAYPVPPCTCIVKATEYRLKLLPDCSLMIPSSCSRTACVHTNFLSHLRPSSLRRAQVMHWPTSIPFYYTCGHHLEGGLSQPNPRPTVNVHYCQPIKLKAMGHHTRAMHLCLSNFGSHIRICAALHHVCLASDTLRGKPKFPAAAFAVMPKPTICGPHTIVPIIDTVIPAKELKLLITDARAALPKRSKGSDHEEVLRTTHGCCK